MSEKQPEALLLAGQLESTELRRLHEVNQELLEALELLVDNPYREGTESDERLRRIARAAIAKATGETA